jgi:hypothetical protein
MSEGFLYRPAVSALLVDVGGNSVPERVRVNVHFEAALVAHIFAICCK